MNNRVRYMKTEDAEVFKTTRSFAHPTNGANYRVVLNKRENQYIILDDNDLVHASGRNTNMITLKKLAKEALQTLGVEFASETGQRNRKSQIAEMPQQVESSGDAA